MLAKHSFGAARGLYTPAMVKQNLAQSRLALRYWPTWLGIALAHASAYLPIGAQRALGRTMGALLHRTLRSRRHIAEVNVTLCFPELSAEQRDVLVRGIFQSTGISVFETARAFFRDPEGLRTRTSVEGIEHLDAARRLGRGVVLAGAHFATLDLAGALLSLFTDFDVIYRPNDNPVIERAMRQGRARLYECVIARDDLKGAITSLKSGHTLWYAADQDYGAKHSVFAPFFGNAAATITMTTRLARINGSPVVFYSHFREPDGRFRLKLSPMLEGYPSGDEVADAARMNRVIETEVRSRPDQYFWLHRRFKTRPSGEPSPYRAQPHKHRRARQRNTER